MAGRWSLMRRCNSIPFIPGIRMSRNHAGGRRQRSRLQELFGGREHHGPVSGGFQQTFYGLSTSKVVIDRSHDRYHFVCHREEQSPVSRSYGNAWKADYYRFI